MVSPVRLRVFSKTVYAYYKKYGRHDLPWRKTTSPYHILVSEIMLQQTQVSRVEGKYRSFLKAFPTAAKLASAEQSEVLKQWSGLGYNRRARFLHQCAKEIVARGRFPSRVEDLETLPGIGHYTARAVVTFAFNQPEVFIETNIRTVFTHHFFPKKKSVSDKELLALIEKTLDRKCPRVWYAALMDYGAFLKQQGITSHRQSAQYKKQPSFIGSNRRARGRVIRALIDSSHTKKSLIKETGCTDGEIEKALSTLLNESLIQKKRSLYMLS